MTPETIYALISDEVYLRSSKNAGLDIAALTGGGTRIAVMDSTDTGLYAEAWNVGGKVIIAFRGTDFSAPDNNDWFSGNLPLGVHEALEAWQQGEITYRRALRLVGVDTIADLYARHAAVGSKFVSSRLPMKFVSPTGRFD